MSIPLASKEGFAKDAVVAWLGADNMRMMAPVFIGDTIRLVVEVIEKNQNKHLPIGKNYRDELLAIINKNRL